MDDTYLTVRAADLKVGDILHDGGQVTRTPRTTGWGQVAYELDWSVEVEANYGDRIKVHRNEAAPRAVQVPPVTHARVIGRKRDRDEEISATIPITTHWEPTHHGHISSITLVVDVPVTLALTQRGDFDTVFIEFLGEDGEPLVWQELDSPPVDGVRIG